MLECVAIQEEAADLFCFALLRDHHLFLSRRQIVVHFNQVCLYQAIT
jgi:hypothetical protein